tara:strand:+ start:396 stop:530 length:135 start_codon:yes stop_codon:yes gene_type:complete
MMKFIFGVIVGVSIMQFDLLPTVKEKFLESGARDVVVHTLKEIK